MANIGVDVFDLSRVAEPLKVPLGSAAAEVVEHDDLMSLVAEIRSGMGADESAASCDENFHLVYLLAIELEIRGVASKGTWVAPEPSHAVRWTILLLKS